MTLFSSLDLQLMLTLACPRRLTARAVSVRQWQPPDTGHRPTQAQEKQSTLLSLPPPLSGCLKWVSHTSNVGKYRRPGQNSTSVLQVDFPWLAQWLPEGSGDNLDPCNPRFLRGTPALKQVLLPGGERTRREKQLPPSKTAPRATKVWDGWENIRPTVHLATPKSKGFTSC